MPRKDEPIEKPTQLLKERLRGVFAPLAKALAGEEEPLHQMRVASRRLRVALPLLARKARGRRVRRALAILRRLTRAAGTSRDLDVSATLFDARLKEFGSAGAPAELLTLRTRLRSSRNRSHTRMAEALLDIEISKLRAELRAIVLRGGEDLFTVFQRIRRSREAEGANLVASLEALGDRFDPDELHRARIRVRRLRYIGEVADAFKGETSPATRLFKELQGQLGHVHDAHVLARWFSEQAKRGDLRGEAHLAEAARAQEARFLETSQREHLAFLKGDPLVRVRGALSHLRPPAPSLTLAGLAQAPRVDGVP